MLKVGKLQLSEYEEKSRKIFLEESVVKYFSIDLEYPVEQYQYH